MLEKYDTSKIKNAVLLFADVINASVYSSILGYQKYAEKVLEFNKIFTETAERYFKKEKTAENYCDINSRGDEGLIFCINSENPSKLLNNIITFAFDLKTRIELLQDMDKPDSEIVPQKIKLGIGIHYGPVSILTNKEKKIIDDIVGYSINYAKRIESSSRIGKFSKIFLSKEANSLLVGNPILTTKYNYPLKGIKTEEEVYEISSAYLFNLNCDEPTLQSDKIIKEFACSENKLDLLEEPWIKNLVISLIQKKILVNIEKKQTDKIKEYEDILKNFAWKNFNEIDPIINFLKALFYLNNKKYTQSISYLKNIVEKYPYFIQARKELIKALHIIVKSSEKISKDAVFARDMTEEMLEFHEQYFISAEEKSEYIKILDELK